MPVKNHEKLSYDAHKKHIEKIKDIFVRFEQKDSVNYWRHERMYSLLTPLLGDGTWLTVGDGIGTDANWLAEKGVDVVASDISDTILKEARSKNYIDRYSQENAECLSFEDNSFDFVLCKEAYHHFPRPYIAVYEMLRAAKKGVVLIEPFDIGIQMPSIIFIKNLLDRLSPHLINKIWKNRYSFEEVGNYVYKTSEREIEKIAMGINLPYVAFKGINDYYTTSLDLSQPTSNKKVFRKVRSKIRFRNLLCRLGIIPYSLQSSIIFKSTPSKSTTKSLIKAGYKVVKLRKNPYLE